MRESKTGSYNANTQRVDSSLPIIKKIGKIPSAFWHISGYYPYI